MRKAIAISWVVGLIMFVAGCGGGGGGGGGSAGLTYSGLTTQATLDAANADSLARASASGAHQSVSTESTPALFRSPIDRDAHLQNLSVRLMQVLQGESGGAGARSAAARTDDLSATLCPVGGSALLMTPDAPNPNNFSYSFQFSSCSHTELGVLYTYDGTISASFAQNPGVSFAFSFAFQNFTITLTDSYTQSATINATMSCSGSDTTNYTDAVCTYYSDFVGFDGRVYRVADVTLAGDDVTGYTISATIYDPDHGYVTLTTATPITFDCPGGHPDSGSLTITGAGGSSATVDFISCTQYVVTHNAAVTVHDW